MAAKPLIYFGALQYNARDWPNAYKIDSAANSFGSIALGFDNRATVYGIAGDAAGYVYLATDPDTITGHSLFKFHRDGQLMWSAAHGAALFGVAVDASGNIYACGQPADGSTMYFSGSRTGFYTLRKFDASGVQQWAVDGDPGAPNPGNYDFDSSVVVDSNGNVAVGSVTIGEYGPLGGVRQHDPADGSLNWRWNNGKAYGWTVHKITADSSGNVYAGDNSGPNVGFVVKLDSTGAQQWWRNLESGRPVKDLKWHDNAILCLTPYYSHSTWAGSLIKLSDADGSTIWDGSNGPDVVQSNHWDRLDIDSDGNIFIAGAGYGKLDSDAQIVFSGSFVEGFAILLRAIAVVETETPALKIPVGFGLPTLIGDLYTFAPGLPLAIALATPRDRLEFAGVVRPATIYRVYLTGGTGTIELPVSYLTVRRDATSAAITVTCPSITNAQVDAILERTAGTIIVKAGVRFSDGVEQLAEMARASYESIRWDAGSRSSSATLTGRSAGLVANPQTRAARGISYDNLTGGRRRVRCAIDPHLAPGDTLDLGGGETMTVGELTISISASSAVMEAAESA